MYYFESIFYGTCCVEAKTSGRYGFGAPKLFVFRSASNGVVGTFTLTHKDSLVASPLRSESKEKGHLLMIAIFQFCELRPDLGRDTVAELNPHGAAFEGQVCNKFGRVVSNASLLPARRLNTF